MFRGFYVWPPWHVLWQDIDLHLPLSTQVLNGYLQGRIYWFAGSNLQPVAQKSWCNIRAPCMVDLFILILSNIDIIITIRANKKNNIVDQYDTNNKLFVCFGYMGHPWQEPIKVSQTCLLRPLKENRATSGHCKQVVFLDTHHFLKGDKMHDI